MSSYKKAMKSNQREHRERSQPTARRGLGLLEKKKDYKLRAQNWHRKQDFLKGLRRKALDKNPDEFYFKMTSTKLKDGVHLRKNPADEETTPDQLKLMRTRDLRYVEMKRVAETKKIERMKGELHLLNANGKQQNRHTFYVDTKRDVEQFNLAERLQTAPELVRCVYNRPRLDTLRTATLQGATDKNTIKNLARQRAREYRNLERRIVRESTLFVTQQKIQTRMDLVDKRQKIKVKAETKTSAAVYCFKTERKR
ncbi:putative U3 small nucleolar RNA-associated protein 11 [Lampetra fluviatilis]